jgi:hypothetical protein
VAKVSVTKGREDEPWLWSERDVELAGGGRRDSRLAAHSDEKVSSSAIFEVDL